MAEDAIIAVAFFAACIVVPVILMRSATATTSARDEWTEMRRTEVQAPQWKPAALPPGVPVGAHKKGDRIPVLDDEQTRALLQQGRRNERILCARHQKDFTILADMITGETWHTQSAEVTRG